MKLFVTGTDTDVGKTFVSCALLEAISREGYSTTAMKPIASGCDWVAGELRNGDALSLMHFSSKKLAYELINPWAFEPAIAPHIAAKEAGVRIDKDEVIQKIEAFLADESDVKLIEGAGGWFVPLNEKETFADFVSALDIPVLLVVSVKLGCINHAILSEEAIRKKGLRLVGWVANICQPIESHAGRLEENIKTLQDFLEAPMLARLDYFGDVCAPDNSLEEKIRMASKSFSPEIVREIVGKN